MPPRMTANPVRPARHRAGKATGASSSSESDSETSEVEADGPRHNIAPPPKVPSAGRIVSHLSKVDLDERRRQGQEAEERRRAAEKAARVAAEEGFVTESEGGGDDESGEEGSSDGSDDDSDSDEEEEEEEAPRRLMLKPKFIPKSQRNANHTPTATATTTTTKNGEEAARLAQEEEEKEKKKKAVDELVEEQMRKDAAARAAGKKHWDDLVDEEDDVDTNDDDENPEAEYAAWKLRELRRIKREREAIEAREKEREEVERRRHLTDEERRAEDEAFLARQKEEKDGKGKMAYMQKYFHRGAFYQDDEAAESLAQRDIMGARFADDVKNRELLPKALQMRDMTKLGKKGASKYRDLQSEDTGRWGEFRDTRRRDDFGRVDDRYGSDRGDHVNDRYQQRERSGPGGANAVPLGDRRGVSVSVSVPGAPEGPRNRDRRGDDGERYRGRDRRGSSRDRNSYRPRDDDDDARRKRDSSRDAGRYEGDKRRRIESSG
ncbi:micro-fibrillar-associated protein 1 [Xylaria flabelliformis]|nr:micro-fibrillar-associated protein 1 [Xylaria flabelliformis]